MQLGGRTIHAALSVGMFLWRVSLMNGPQHMMTVTRSRSKTPTSDALVLRKLILSLSSQQSSTHWVFPEGSGGCSAPEDIKGTNSGTDGLSVSVS